MTLRRLSFHKWGSGAKQWCDTAVSVTSTQRLSTREGTGRRACLFLLYMSSNRAFSDGVLLIDAAENHTAPWERFFYCPFDNTKKEREKKNHNPNSRIPEHIHLYSHRRAEAPVKVTRLLSDMDEWSGQSCDKSLSLAVFFFPSYRTCIILFNWVSRWSNSER